MIACIIEFQIKPGQEERQQDVLSRLLDNADNIEGFLGKKAYSPRGGPQDDILTISYWRDQEALDRWVADPDHQEAIAIGKNETLKNFTIRVANVDRAYGWSGESD